MNRKLLITSAIVASLLGLATAAAITFVIWGVITESFVVDVKVNIGSSAPSSSPTQPPPSLEDTIVLSKWVTEDDCLAKDCLKILYRFKGETEAYTLTLINFSSYRECYSETAILKPLPSCWQDDYFP